MAVIIGIPGIAAGTWREGVAASANLPASGNALYDARVSVADQTIYLWLGSSWVGIAGGGGGGGVTTVGSFSASAQTNGATISSTTITFGPASNTVPGMVGTGSQTWAGVKSFSSAPIFSSGTASTVPYLDSGKALASSAVTPTELGYVSGVTSAIQTQLTAKSPSASPTFTGTVTLPSGTVSSSAWDTGTSTFTSNGVAFTAKAPTASPTFTGTVTLPSGSVTSGAWDTGTSTLTSNGVAFTAKAPLASPTFTGTVTLPNAVTVTSSAMTFGNTQRITFGTSSFGNDSSDNVRLSALIPSGGRFLVEENSEQVVSMFADQANWGALALSRDWTMQWQMGKNSSHYGRGKVRGYGSSTQTGNGADNTEDDLISKTVAASVLANNDEDLTIVSWGTTGATGNTKTIKLYVGGTAIGTISTTANAKVWRFDAIVTRTGASTEKYVVTANIDGTITIVSGTLAVSTTGTIVVKTTGQSSGSAANDVVNEALRVDYDRAGN